MPEGAQKRHIECYTGGRKLSWCRFVACDRFIMTRDGALQCRESILGQIHQEAVSLITSIQSH